MCLNLLSHSSFEVYNFFNQSYVVGCLHASMSFDTYYVDAESCIMHSCTAVRGRDLLVALNMQLATDALFQYYQKTLKCKWQFQLL